MFTCIGIQKVNFTAGDGSQIDGIKIHATYENSNVDGSAVETFFLGRTKFGSIVDTIKVGDEFSIAYNKYGKAEHITIIS